MSNRAWIGWVVVMMAGTGSTAHASVEPSSGEVSVEVLDIQGSSFEQFPVRAERIDYRAYLQAQRGARYCIRVHNSSGERIGVVIAVDGRNIISGARSDLKRNEPMYVLSPGETEHYSGWRTSLRNVHEFYFTDWQDSYAEGFGDRSARGVIAVAVYHEQPHIRFTPSPIAPPSPAPDSNSTTAPAPPAAGAPPEVGALDEKPAQSRRADPGTGFGDRRYEPVTRVAFEAEEQPRSRVFLKYEWPETLCRKHIAPCGADDNRFWKDDGNDLAFAPFPPGRR